MWVAAAAQQHSTKRLKREIDRRSVHPGNRNAILQHKHAARPETRRGSIRSSRQAAQHRCVCRCTWTASPELRQLRYRLLLRLPLLRRPNVGGSAAVSSSRPCPPCAFGQLVDEAKEEEEGAFPSVFLRIKNLRGSSGAYRRRQ